ncbi:pheromone A receptor-domain-containing protein [Abortiporus biennis]|nr:pheromone A receptor-domain-containing protein [Abortiporus biennis]
MSLHPSLIAGSVVAAVVSLIPIPSFYRDRNAPVLSLVAWIFTLSVIYAINSIIWRDGNDAKILVWCDVVTKLNIGALSAIPAAALCVARRLELLSSGRMAYFTIKDDRRQRVLELAFCLCVPILMMALHLFVQPRRFDLISGVGCRPAIYPSVLSLVLLWVIPLLLSAVTLIFLILALGYFFSQRIDFTTHLNRTGSSLTTKQYLRLMGMTATVIVWSIITCAIAMRNVVLSGMQTSMGWNDVHTNFGQINRIDLSDLSTGQARRILVSWWSIPVSAYIFFIFFAFGEETIREYKNAGRHFFRFILRRPAQVEPEALGVLPPFKNGAPQQIIVHKLSTVDIRSDFSNDDLTLPSYSPSRDVTFSKGTSKRFAPSSARSSDDDLKKPSLSPLTFRNYADNKTTVDKSIPSPFSLSSQTTLQRRISISDEFPPSRPPTPPIHEEPLRENVKPVEGVSKEQYKRPFSPPTVYRIPASLEHSSNVNDVVPGVIVTVHSDLNDIV